MPQFIPAILEQDKLEVIAQLSKLGDYVSRVQIDFADGTLVANQTALPEELPALDGRLEVDAHLMVSHPSQYLETLASLGFTMVIVHAECAESLAQLAAQTKALHLNLGLAINPETPILPTLDLANYSLVQLMSIHPGFSNQPFIEKTFARLRQFKSIFPLVPVAIDGGVRLTNARALIDAGAEFLVVGQQGFEHDGDTEAGIVEWEQFLAQR